MRKSVFCSKTHPSTKCFSFNVKQKKTKLLKEGRCFVCFKKGHLSQQCSKSSYSCFKCGQKHHISICDKKENDVNAPEKTPATEISTQTTIGENKQVLLQTAQAELRSHSNKINSRLLFDTGSQRTYITKECKDRLNAPVLRTEPTIIQTFGHENSTIQDMDIVSIKIKCADGAELRIECIVVPMICADLVGQQTVKISKSFSHLKNCN